MLEQVVDTVENQHNPEISEPFRGTILVVDDERLIRDVLTVALEAQLPGCRVDTAQSLGAAIEYLQRRPDTDVVVLDYRMADMRGIKSIERIVRLAKKKRVIVLSGHITSEISEDLRKIRVSAALTKDVGMIDLARSIVRVVKGETLFDLPDPDNKYQQLQEQFNLSKREAQIMQYIVNGTRNSEIAHKLGINESTVRVHVYHIFKKLGVTSRIEAFNCWKAIAGQA